MQNNIFKILKYLLNYLIYWFFLHNIYKSSKFLAFKKVFIKFLNYLYFSIILYSIFNLVFNQQYNKKIKINNYNF